MPDYKEMYRVLFQEMTKTISALQKAQQQTEKMYVEGNLESNCIAEDSDEVSGDEEEPFPRV